MKPRITPLRQTWRQLMHSVGSRASRLRACLLALCAAAAVQGLALVCLIPLLRALIPQPDGSAALPWLAVMSAFMLASLLLRGWALGFDYRGDMVQSSFELRSALGEQLRRIPLEQLQEKRAGEIHAALLGGVDENLSFLMTVAGMAANALVTPLVVALAAMGFDWRIGVLLLLLFALLIPLYRWRRPAYGRGMRMLAEAHARTGAALVEYTQGLPVLRAACCTGEQATRLQQSLQHLQSIQTIGQKKGAKPNLVLASSMELGILLVVSMAAYWVVQGSLDIALLAALLVMAVRFAEPLANVVLFAKVIDLMEAALDKMDALRRIQPLPVQTPPEGTPIQEPQTFDIRVDGVTFHYASDDKNVLHDCSADIPARRMTALVGASGCGKTTLTRLILRHADPQAGRITIGGVDIRTMEPERLNALVSVVFQDVYLFDDSIAANIRMARPDASDDEIEAAARAAHCHDFITRLPQGYQTRAGDIGARFSGGERQRISIARAMLKNAPIVILDEPTAALDTESEVAVQAAMDALVRARTVIVIAHRLSTIAAASQILVLDAGCVVESGRHQDLLTRQGHYARMWQAQQSAKHWHVGTNDCEFMLTSTLENRP